MAPGWGLPHGGGPGSGLALKPHSSPAAVTGQGGGPHGPRSPPWAVVPIVRAVGVARVALRGAHMVGGRLWDPPPTRQAGAWETYPGPWVRAGGQGAPSRRLRGDVGGNWGGYHGVCVCGPSWGGVRQLGYLAGGWGPP